MSDVNSKINNFERALQRLQEARHYWLQENMPDVVRDGLIQRFEFTYELAWKSAKEVLASSGIVDANSPKAVMREAYAHKLIQDETTWLQLILDRNQTSHVYKEEIADEIAARICSTYISAFEHLLLQLKHELE